MRFTTTSTNTATKNSRSNVIFLLFWSIFNSILYTTTTSTTLLTVLLLQNHQIQSCYGQKIGLNFGRKVIDKTSTSGSDTRSNGNNPNKKKKSFSFVAEAASANGEYIIVITTALVALLAFVMNDPSRNKNNTIERKEEELDEGVGEKDEKSPSVNKVDIITMTNDLDDDCPPMSMVRVVAKVPTANSKKNETSNEDVYDDDLVDDSEFKEGEMDAPFDEDEQKNDANTTTTVQDVYRDDCEVGFEDVKVILSTGKKKPDKIILDGSIRAKARPGRMMAIMGPSGCGKSTLLHALAGKIKQDPKMSVYGKRYVDNEPLTDDSFLPIAFVTQETNFFPHMTVKETLDFRVELKLGSKLGKSAREDVVSELMDLMGLSKSADTIVGNVSVKGLSGGERKRLSIACEMISSPPVIFLDEPTSGLDSYQAAQVVKFLRKLADNGKTIVSVIHQPSQQIFSMFDDLLLMSEGRLMYYGEVKQVRSYLSGIGYACPNDVGTAEHVLDCISRSTSSLPEHQSESDDRLNHLAKEAHQLTDELFPSSSVATQHQLKFVMNGVGKRAAGIFRQFRLLLKRAFNEEGRGKTAIILKLVQQVSMSVIFGGIYNFSNNQASIMDRFGLIALLGTVTTNIALASTVRSFPKERSIISSEMSSGMYQTLPYLFAKAMAELPLIGIYNGIFSAIIYPLSGLQEGKFMNFLGITTMHSFASNSLGLLIGSVSKNSDVALAMMPPIIALNVIFDGRNIAEENTPFLLKWVPKIGLIRWFFEGLSVNEFNGLTFDTSGPRRGPVAKTGFDALDRFGIADRTLAEVFTAQTRIVVGCWVLTYLGLSLTKEKFEKMNVPGS